MPTQNIVLTIFLVPLFSMLYGCQPGEAPQQTKASVSKAPTATQPASGNSATSVVSSADAMKLANKIGCLACHSLEKKLLGPAWKNVAAINRGNPDAEARLMNKIAKGGSGVWGKIDMPAYPKLGEEQSRVLVKFILSLE